MRLHNITLLLRGKRGIEKDLSSGLKIIFDFRTKASYNIWGDLSSKLKFVDENGEEIKFQQHWSMPQIMVDKGWKFQQAYSSAYGGKPIVLDFLQRCQ